MKDAALVPINMNISSHSGSLLDSPVLPYLALGFGIPYWLVSSTLTLLLIRPTFTKEESGALTYPLRSHLVNVLFQLFVLYPANCALVFYPRIFMVRISCMIAIHINGFGVLASISSTCFYVVAVCVEIVRPLHVHTWFSPSRSRLALALVWMVPIVLNLMSLVVHIVGSDGDEISFCYTQVLAPSYLYMYSAVVGVFLIFILSVSCLILRTSKKQANQIMALNMTVTGSGEENTQRMRSKLYRSYLIVAVINGIFVVMLLTGNISTVDCVSEICAYGNSGAFVVLCVMDALILTIVKFRVSRSRFRELCRSFCHSQ